MEGSDLHYYLTWLKDQMKIHVSRSLPVLFLRLPVLAGDLCFLYRLCKLNQNISAENLMDICSLGCRINWYLLHECVLIVLFVFMVCPLAYV